jgi:hypothetical protein
MKNAYKLLVGKWNDNIKMDFKGIACEDMRFINSLGIGLRSGLLRTW